MLPLAGAGFPHSIDELVVGLRAGLKRHQIFARDVQASGGWPALEELSLDLTGAQLSRATATAKRATLTEPGPSIHRLSLIAAPLNFESVPLTFNLTAADARSGFARDDNQEPVLHILQAKSGALVVEAKRRDLESLLQKLAAEALAKHGAEIKSTRLDFTSRGPRTLEFRASVKAKVFVMNAEIRVTGQLSVDDDFNLSARHLAVDGSGMIASLASGYLRPRFAELEERVLPLATFSLGEVHLRDLRLSGGETLRLEADFGE
jgi:hypothetical protein